MSISGRVCFIIALLALGACDTTISTDELNSGLPEQTVVDIMGEPPLSRDEFSMPDNPNTRFTVLQYNMSVQNDWAPTPHWILFDSDGLVTYGEGGIPEAKTRAYSAYYDWMTGHGKMSYQKAESRIYANYKETYGRNLNPSVDRYLQSRLSVMQRLDEGKIDRAEADRLIQEEFADLSRSVPLLGDGQERKDDGSTFGRAAAVAALGPDLNAFKGRRRPRAARTHSRPCSGPGGRSVTQSRCF